MFKLLLLCLYMLIATDQNSIKHIWHYCLFLNKGIENLPYELQRNFTLMRELDQRTQGWCTIDLAVCLLNMQPPKKTSLCIASSCVYGLKYLPKVACLLHTAKKVTLNKYSRGASNMCHLQVCQLIFILYFKCKKYKHFVKKYHL